MSELAEETQILIFRLCSSVLITGVSVICFVLPGLLKEQSIRLFSFLHSFCTGVMLGMGFIVYILESYEVSRFSFQVSLLLAACAFISIVALEQFATSSAYDYKPLNMAVGSEVDDDGMELSAISEPNFNAMEIDRDDESHPLHHGELQMIDNRHLKFYPSVVLTFASTYDFLSGIVLAFEEHSNYVNLIQYALTKALMAITFGTVLESLSAPASIFQWFAFVFTISSPLGILLGAYVIPQILSSEYLIPLINSCISVVSALAAGVFLNIAVMNMIPAELYSMDNLNSSSGADQETVSRSERMLKLAAFVVGFVITISPFYIMDN